MKRAIDGAALLEQHGKLLNDKTMKFLAREARYRRCHGPLIIYQADRFAT